MFSNNYENSVNGTHWYQKYQKNLSKKKILLSPVTFYMSHGTWNMSSGMFHVSPTDTGTDPPPAKTPVFAISLICSTTRSLQSMRFLFPAQTHTITNIASYSLTMCKRAILCPRSEKKGQGQKVDFFDELWKIIGQFDDFGHFIINFL